MFFTGIVKQIKVLQTCAVSLTAHPQARAHNTRGCRIGDCSRTAHAFKQTKKLKEISPSLPLHCTCLLENISFLLYIMMTDSTWCPNKLIFNFYFESIAES